ncbi:MAG: ABC transporter permease, partial [Cyclobacteriaceae bacterium]|nr:ABC transporter permease [Cyclobacteriaceae bacterium]
MGIINYTNLTTAKSTLRSKEMAIKKVSGSSGKLLGLQLILESITISLIAFMLAITLIQSFSGFFKTVFLMSINPMENFGPGFLAIALCGVILIGLLAGIYPAFLLTSFHPVSLIKKTFNKSAGGTLVRKGLMTMQFTVTVVLMIGIIVNYRQLNFARNMNTGFNGEKVITVVKPNGMKRSMRNAFKDRLLQESTISKVSFSNGNPGDPSIISVENEIDGIKRSMITFLADPDYISLMDIKMADGNDFSWDRPGERYDFVSNSLPDHYAGMIINESAVKEFDLKNPIGKTIVYPKNNKGYKFKIIGVVRDFNFQSIHHKIEPLVIIWGPNSKYINIKCNTSDFVSTINA